jgi:hypothetical protein
MELITYGRNISWMAVADRDHPMATVQVQVLASLVVIYIATLSPYGSNFVQWIYLK